LPQAPGDGGSRSRPQSIGFWAQQSPGPVPSNSQEEISDNGRPPYADLSIVCLFDEADELTMAVSSAAPMQTSRSKTLERGGAWLNRYEN
jgi:hypothetical protein